MDGGSGLNLIYEDTLHKMEIDRSRIKQSNTTFRGIIPSREARCAGKITLDVVFGTPENYRSEEITFQVAPFSSGYHALLGRILLHALGHTPLRVYEAQNVRTTWYNHDVYYITFFLYTLLGLQVQRFVGQ